MEKLKMLGHVLPKQEQKIINGGRSKSICDYFARCINSSDCVSNIPGCNYICYNGSFGKPKIAGVCIAA